MRSSCRFVPFVFVWLALTLLLVAMALWATPAHAARMFILDTVSQTSDPALPWPAGPAGLTGRFDAAVQVCAVPASPGNYVWDVLASPAVVAFTQAHVAAARFLGTHYSDLRALAATRPALIGAIWRKLVSRQVTVNGQSVTVRLLVPQSDSTAGDVEITHEVPFNHWFGVSDGED